MKGIPVFFIRTLLPENQSQLGDAVAAKVALFHGKTARLFGETGGDDDVLALLGDLRVGEEVAVPAQACLLYTSSYKTLEKAGFQREGYIRDGKMVNTYCNYYLYGLTKTDYMEITDKKPLLDGK